MKLKDILTETYSALFTNKIRTFLTILGIVIGIASVIAMTAIGQGAQNSISKRIESIGANLIIVTPGAQRSFSGPNNARGGAQTLTLEDADAIEKQIENISYIAREVSTRKQIIAEGYNTNTNIIGTESSYAQARNIEMSEGSFISLQNVNSGSKVAVLGPTTRDDLFGIDTSETIGQTIRISGSNYKIIGITKAKGGTGFNNTDDVVYIPYTTAQRYLVGNKYLTQINISAENTEISSTVQEKVTSLLMERHKITDATKIDFSTMNQTDIIATASSVTSTFTTLLAAIAGISLLVGGIGIMNMMLTTVTERTKEIGLRKAIGARKKDINKQFLLEAIILTFSGGILGVILGWLISIGISSFSELEASVSFSSIFFAFGISALIGIIFGYYPARRAANLNPIEALRYE